jgi:S-adenosylmethionine-diacylglycerol 3-amino-3-carboxypropyl transferase
MLALPKPLSRLAHDTLFERLHGGNLVYNTCWEDPRVDHELLELRRDSRVVMITSAGCNALDYLLADPASIDAVDVNPRQNALLQLKVALIRESPHAELFQVFGNGHHADFEGLVRSLQLPGYAASYWQKKAYYFQKSRLNPTFYWRGTAGQMAWLALQAFTGINPRAQAYLNALLVSTSVAEQKNLYEAVRPHLWHDFIEWLLKQPFAMALLGVPRAQMALIEGHFPGGLPGFIRAKMERVLVDLPFSDNYFWRVYLTGHYTPECCPRYLLPEHQETLRSRVPRLQTHTSTLANFLRENPGPYSHFVLLDHQDWLASHQPEALEEEWRLILASSRPGARILLRSASLCPEFIPSFARERLHPDPRSESLHLLDRAGTYGCTLAAKILS